MGTIRQASHLQSGLGFAATMRRLLALAAAAGLEAVSLQKVVH